MTLVETNYKMLETKSQQIFQNKISHVNWCMTVAITVICIASSWFKMRPDLSRFPNFTATSCRHLSPNNM